MKSNLIVKAFTITFLLIMGMVGTHAQQNISGYVSDGKVPIPGASIIVKGTSLGTATDFDGNFSLANIAPNDVLVISSIGFIAQEIQVGNTSYFEIVLKEDTELLDEVVLVGYTTQRKADLSGAVATVDVEQLERTRVPNVSQALQGQVAGVQVTASTGAPGEPVEIRIRGEGTIGNNDPLYVVDGIPSRDIAFLNQGDIKSITVLKDAAAAAIYGSRASGGVVLITTKQGAKGKMSFNIDYFNGFNKAVNLPKMLNSEQYINTLETAWDNTYTDDNPYTADRGRSDFADTDWLDELFETGRTQNLQLTTSGGNEKLQYLMSLGYYGQDGIVVYDNDTYDRINYRTNISADLNDRLKVGTNMQLSYDKRALVASKGESLIRYALLRAPVIPVYKNSNDPTYSERDPFTDLPFYTETGYDVGLQRSMYELVGNPIARAYFTDNTEKIYRTFGNVFGEYRFLKDKNLTFRTNVGIDLAFFHNKVFNENYGDDDGGGNALDAGLGRQNRPNSLNESRGEAFTLTVNNTLNYKTLLNEKHSLSALVGMEYITNYTSSIGASRARFPYTDDEFRYLDYGGTELDLWNSGSASEWSLFSYFGSASYSYDNKYMLTANLRADASSRFADDNQWGYFPSVSAGWQVSEETFLAEVDWLSNLKLRASWGILGNQEIDNYTYLTLINQENGIVRTNRFGNPDLKWESSEQVNIGLDAGFLKNTLNFTVEYFNKNTSDILLPISLPSVVGNVEPTILNAGEVRNKGFEFSVNYQNSERSFKYGINANLATLDNEVQKLHPNLPNIVGEVSRTTVGQPLNAYYGYQVEGIYQNQAEIDQHLRGTNNPSVKPGDIRFKDFNGDGVISADNDRGFIGSPIPEVTFGLSFNSSYNGWDFSFLFQGVEGVDRYNDGKKIVDFDTRPFNFTEAILGAWNGENTSNSIPRVAFEDNGSSKISSIFVEDASYIRLKNIELGYTLKDIKGINGLRLYLSGQNLWTLTDYTGLDPETTDLVDKGTYPSSAAVLFGINAKF